MNQTRLITNIDKETGHIIKHTIYLYRNIITIRIYDNKNDWFATCMRDDDLKIHLDINLIERSI